MSKFVNDMLKERDGKWSRKSWYAFLSFFLGVGYEFGLGFFIETKEYVFITLLGVTTAVIFATVADKKNTKHEL